MLAPLIINLDHKPNVQYPKEPTILRERRCYFAAVCWQNGFLSEITQEIIVLFLFFYIMILIFVILYFTLESMWSEAL